MFSSYPQQGMGATGLGAGATSMAAMPTGINPQLLAAIMAQQQQSAQQPPNPMQQGAGAATSPMSSLMASGAPGAGAAPPHPLGMAPVSAPPAPAQANSGTNPAQIMQIMQMLKGGQSGVQAAPTGGWNPNNPIGTSTLGGATADQGSALANFLASLGRSS